MKNTNLVQAVAFDLDGTLVNSIEDLAQSANALRAHFNRPPLKDDVLKSYIGDGIFELVKRTVEDIKFDYPKQDILEDALKFFLTYYDEHLTDNTCAYPKVAEGLELLKILKLPLMVITNKNEMFATHILKNLGLMDYFNLVIGGNTLPQKKPAALPLLHGAKMMNIPPENMMMVGDSKNDVLSAKAANSIPVLVNYGYSNPEKLNQDEKTRVDIVISAITDLYDIIKNDS